jgi:manganese-dependent inorganic pyrophosphatase
MMSEPPVYVVGHKNPDADSICSAIGYAAYKHALGLKQFVPARCGNSNPRIDAILNHFDVPLPLFLGDVTPRVKHIMKTRPHVVDVDATCSDALSLIDEFDYRALPVVGEDGILEGLITIFGLGDYFTPKVRNPLDMRRVRTRISDIIRCLGARVVNLRDEDEEADLYVRVGAMDIRSFDRSAHENLVPAQSSIVVVGDRWDIQEKCIQLGVRLIVITGGLSVDSDIAERVKEKGVSLIVSPHDTATTSWIIRTATGVRHLMEKVKYRFSEDDTVASVKRRILELNGPLFLVTDERGALKGVFSKTDLLRPVKTSLVLVDHNEMSQAVDGAREVQITEIIDHHRLGSFTTEQPILFMNEPVGSTSTIVGNLFRRSGLPLDPKVGGVLMAGIIADTLNLHSPTTTEVDRQTLEWLSERSGASIDALSELIFRTGSTISSLPPDQVVEADCKHYRHGEISFAVCQVEELGFDPFWECWERLYQALEAYRAKNQLFFATLLVTDINKQNSLLLISGDSLTIESISYPHVEKNVVFELNGVVSRKKQLIPYLTSCLKGIGISVSE